jgi:hypothetical protein
MISLRFLLGILLVVNCLSLRAQEVENKLDTVLTMQKEMLEKQEAILGHVKPSEPLANKSFGIEFNPALALLGSADGLILSGGVSFFTLDRNAEVSIPVYYAKDNHDNYSNFFVDAHYRRFIGGHQKGFYIGGGGRYQRIRGEEGDIIDFDENGAMTTAHRFGLMFGIGFRYFNKSGFYWGTSFSLGRYFTDTDKKFESHFGISEKLLWDFELLKFGYAF